MERKKITLNLADYVKIVSSWNRGVWRKDKNTGMFHRIKDRWVVDVVPSFKKQGSVMKWLNSVDEVFE